MCVCVQKTPAAPHTGKKERLVSFARSEECRGTRQPPHFEARLPTSGRGTRYCKYQEWQSLEKILNYPGCFVPANGLFASPIARLWVKSKKDPPAKWRRLGRLVSTLLTQSKQPDIFSSECTTQSPNLNPDCMDGRKYSPDGASRRT